VGLRAGLVTEARGKILCHCRGTSVISKLNKFKYNHWTLKQVSWEVNEKLVIRFYVSEFTVF
jgi:hypothetical protein